jgi:hypothetical protein
MEGEPGRTVYNKLILQKSIPTAHQNQPTLALDSSKLLQKHHVFLPAQCVL